MKRGCCFQGCARPWSRLWNILAFLILGLSTPLALEQRATGRPGWPFLISVHELPGAEQGWIPWHRKAVTLGARGLGNCQKHLENIAGCGSNFLQCNCQTHAENIWDVIRACIPYGTTRNIQQQFQICLSMFPMCFNTCAQWVHCMCSTCVLHFLQSFGCIHNVLQNKLMYSKCTHWAHILKHIRNIDRQIWNCY